MIQLLIGSPDLLLPMLAVLGLVLLASAVVLTPKIKIIHETQIQLILLLILTILQIGTIILPISRVVYLTTILIIANLIAYIRLEMENQILKNYQQAASIIIIIILFSILTYPVIMELQPVPIELIAIYMILFPVYDRFANTITRSTYT